MYNIGEGTKKMKAIQPAKRKERKNKDACALCIGPSQSVIAFLLTLLQI
jgi:hypothetical protein